jgi:hypothetical protein
MDGLLRPLFRSPSEGAISKDIALRRPVGVRSHADTNDTSFVSVLSRSGSRIDCYDDTTEVRMFFDSAYVNDLAIPQSTGDVVKNLTFEFLTTESSASVTLFDLLEEWSSKV